MQSGGISPLVTTCTELVRLGVSCSAVSLFCYEPVSTQYYALVRCGVLCIGQQCVPWPLPGRYRPLKAPLCASTQCFRLHCVQLEHKLLRCGHSALASFLCGLFSV